MTTTQNDLPTHSPDDLLKDMEFQHVPIVSIGGGLGSFALVDRLRIGGVSADDIRVVSLHRQPEQAFADACRDSGMGPRDRLRSDSSARIDNLWGFPGYAAREARETKRPSLMLRSLVEPVLAQPYAPTVGLVQHAVKEESARIGWNHMTVRGMALRVQRQPDGGYVVIVRRRGNRRDLALVCDYVHLAIGPFGPKLTPEAVSFRLKHPYPQRLVHAYEQHSEVYDQLAEHGGSVLVRGSGIASSRVIQRLLEDRERSGQDIHIWQLFRHYHDQPTGPLLGRRDAGYGYAHQPYDYPKAAYGGQLRDTMKRRDESDRIALSRKLGATSTPYRTEWARPLREARAEGWYDALAGEVHEFVALQRDGKDQVRAKIRLANKETYQLDVDYVIDATGMDQQAENHPLIHDLVEQGIADVNDLGCLRVDDNFMVVGSESHSENQSGAIFASGMNARGGPLAPVDSFLGLQSAALSIADVLADHGLGKRLTPARSVRQWWKWMGRKSL
ncbi:hypothetical protein G5C66_20335 [Nocardioides sp. KC13]|uniref:Uncharacterized protein n=1 Tax=Nocardioides turkmenicus TaxID=2711220 RepID=A0A6M1QYK8_9ACTN|nr:hypothetical protein [Nocardioides sp. KC13]NGN95073.1 hypothetical protein [Nocardioides sp. KC13]